ncbi:MAG TPA: hypothetical protein PLF01_06105 [Alphaproteobacteria bacterium]|nr:hypothetical protein [Alphaproteobacteria bacterium]
MKKISFKNRYLGAGFAALSVIGATTFMAAPAMAQIDMSQKPVLVITNKAMPATNVAPIYSRPSVAPEITPDQVSGAAYFQEGNTVVGNKIQSLSNDLFGLQSSTSRLTEQLRAIEARGKNMAASYYASIATINTQLQTGTTPGNPRLIAKLDTAQGNLDVLANNVADLNSLAVEIADAASRGSYLLETTRSTYNLSGAVEEDHARLAQMEDQINGTIVTIDRLLNDVNDDITRTTAYLSTERNNLRTLALAVTNGDLYGKSLANHPFSRAQQSSLLQTANFTPGMPAAPVMQQPAAPMMAPSAPALSSPRPLAKIRFDKPNVDYEQPIYAAVQDALQKYPNSRFELIAVNPTSGNAAQVAIESTRARRNAERVLRTLTQMGVPLEQIDLSYAPSAEARSSEVHLFVR